jgi:hypothetical protein
MTPRVGGDAIIAAVGLTGAPAPAPFSLTVQMPANMTRTRLLAPGLPVATAPAGPDR